MDVRGAVKKAHATLENAGLAGDLDAEVLLALALEKPRSFLHGWPEQELTTTQSSAFEVLLARRLAGEPLAYITGEREFWSLSLRVNKHALIPRPETETLVEQALNRIPADKNTMVLDLGTGSGAIALAIASERPMAQITATDLSKDALVLAKQNAIALNLANVEWQQGDWFEPLGTRQFDVVVSNPPYVAEGDPHLEQGDLPAEPIMALVASGDGLDAIREIARGALGALVPGGWLLLEHGYDQQQAVAAILRDAQYDTIASYKDPAGIVRVTEGQKARQTGAGGP